MNDLNAFTGLVRRCVEDYDMIAPGDTVAVGVSGGKDSLVLLLALNELRRYYPKPFSLEAITVELGFEGMDFTPVAELCTSLGVPYTRLKTDIKEVVFDVRKEDNPCSLCARMRRGYLYKKAQELGCNKIALGHHFNDVIETTVMSMFYGSQLQAMPPKLHSTNFPGMVLIRPLYCVREEDIIAWKRYNDLEFIQCACRFTENCTTCDNGGGGSKRQEVKVLLRRLKRDNPNIENSIFRSIHGVALDTMPGYKTEGQEHSFLERFDRVGAELQKEVKEKQKQEADKTE